MKNPDYWRTHYVVETPADEIAAHLQVLPFTAGTRVWELVAFTPDPRAPCLLLSQGSGGHAYVFAELGYQLSRQGYNVFIMPKHGGATIPVLMARHCAALTAIASRYNDRIGIYSEGLGGFVCFYLALAHAPFRSLLCQNAPAIMTEPAYQAALFAGPGAARRRELIVPLAHRLVRVLPRLPLPISVYLDWRELIDTLPANRRIETRLVDDGYLRDPDFDHWYPLAAIMSLLTTPPPRPLAILTTPTLFQVATHGIIPAYINALYDRLPPIPKQRIAVDGSVYWMLSHPRAAACLAGAWFAATL